MKLFAIDRFDQNEWFIIIGILITYTIFFFMPKKFPRSITLLLFLWAFSVPNFLDFTIGGGLFDFYDVNDSPRYCVMDFVSYFFYGPFGYFFIYFYERFRVKAPYVALYIIIWSLLSIGVECLMLHFKVITYKNNYHLYASYVIYLFVQSLTILFYRWLKEQEIM